MEITLEDLAEALLYCSADGEGGRTMESVLRCLDIDPDGENAERAKAEIRGLRPDIDGWFGGATFARPDYQLPEENEYRDDTVVKTFIGTMLDRRWRPVQSIPVFMCLLVQPGGPQKIDEAIAIASNPWHAKNGARSLLRKTKDAQGTLLYRMDFVIPGFVLDICEQAWGPLPMTKTAIANQQSHRCQFGLAIRKRRMALGWSQVQLADAAQVHRNFVGHVERGDQNVSIDSLVHFAKALKISLADLFADAGL